MFHSYAEDTRPETFRANAKARTFGESWKGDLAPKPYSRSARTYVILNPKLYIIISWHTKPDYSDALP